MNNKKRGRITGLAFIIATVAGVSSAIFTKATESTDYLAQINQNPKPFLVGALMIIIMGIACAAIAISVYPILSKHSKGLAIGAVGFRVVEAALFVAVASVMASLVPVAHQLAADGQMALQNSADVLLSVRSALSGNAGFAFSAGALLYYIGFYKTRLVPRWLSIWGIIAIALHLAVCTMVFFGADSFATVPLAMNMPIALQEMVLAVWLLIFGFKDIPTNDKV